MIVADAELWARCERMRIAIRRFTAAVRDDPPLSDATREAAHVLAECFAHDQQPIFGLIADLRRLAVRRTWLAAIGWAAALVAVVTR